MNTMSAPQLHIINQFLSQFIVPHFYTKEHFHEMTEWSDGKVERFKQYLTDQDDEGIKDIVRGYIETFEEEDDRDEEQEDDSDEEQEDDSDEEQEDESNDELSVASDIDTDDICKNCDLRFYDILLTNKEKHGDWCHCLEK